MSIESQDGNEWMDAEFLAEIRELFKAGAPATMESIRQAAEAGNLVQIARLAHTLAGESGAIGDTAIEHCCRQLIELAHAGKQTDVTRLVDQLGRLVQAATA